jgi:regulator of RNase E activity RraA
VGRLPSRSSPKSKETETHWNDQRRGTLNRPAYTVEFVPATDTVSTRPSVHHVDSCPKGSVIVIKTPAHLPNAVWGGLMSARASFLGAQGVVVEGRIRDVQEIQEMGLPVFSTGFSTLGILLTNIPQGILSP